MHPSAVTNHAGLGKSYSYDANGNMLTRGNQTLTWDIDNRVSSIAISGGGSTSMEYDYAGVRVKKNAPAGITLYPFAGYEIDPNGVITKFIRIGIENFASKKGTNKYFYHNDHLESVNVITDIAGTRVQLNEYDPWGTVSRSEGAIDLAHRFTGQKLDPETGFTITAAGITTPRPGGLSPPIPSSRRSSIRKTLTATATSSTTPRTTSIRTGIFIGIRKSTGSLIVSSERSLASYLTLSRSWLVCRQEDFRL
jgi:hypothetical protein